MSSFLRPKQLDEALEALSIGEPTIIAGGTDFYPARVGKPLDDDVLDITAIEGLRVIEDRGDHIYIGARSTWSDLIRADLPDWLTGMKLAAKEVGGVQIQNAATIVGNICNASPAADGVPGLLALDASIILASTSGERTLPVSEFILGNRKTKRQSNEMVLGISIPACKNGAKSTFLKLGARKYLVISIVMVSAILETSDDGTVERLRLSVGSCSEVACRLTDAERLLVGRKVDSNLASSVVYDHLKPLSPIDDVRGTAAYRRDVSLTLVRRAITELV